MAGDSLKLLAEVVAAGEEVALVVGDVEVDFVAGVLQGVAEVALLEVVDGVLVEEVEGDRRELAIKPWSSCIIFPVLRFVELLHVELKSCKLLNSKLGHLVFIIHPQACSARFVSLFVLFLLMNLGGLCKTLWMYLSARKSKNKTSLLLGGTFIHRSHRFAVRGP